jgi:hypothetical protein
MRSIPTFPVRDLKFEEITKCAHEDWELPALKNPSLEYVAQSFRANISRVRFLMLLPTQIAGLMALTQRTYDIAEYKITGTLTGDQLSLPPEVISKIYELGKVMLDAQIQHTEAQRGTPDWDAFVGKFHSDAGYSLKGLTEIPLGAYGFLEMLSTPITGTWTAIEALLGDLWEASLNCHPKTLALLKGKADRIGKSSTEIPQYQRSGSDPDRETKSVPLNLIGMNGFDLRNSMGTVFRRQRRFEFTRLPSIREAYSQAFSVKYGRIDAALGNKSLDCLSAVRNLIVHKASIADAEYGLLANFDDDPASGNGRPRRRFRRGHTAGIR